MARRSLIYAGFVCIVVILTQIASLLISPQLLRIFTQAIQPGVYALLMIGVYAFLGKDLRPVRKIFQANISAILSLIMYASMVMLVSYWFGGGRNIMAPNLTAVIRNIQLFALPLVFSEVVRFKLIKSCAEKHRVYMIVVLTLVYAFANLDGLRGLINNTNPDYAGFFFESVLPALTISGVVSFICIKGTLISVLIVSFVYNLGGTFSPLLPVIDRILWSLTVSILAFIVGVIYYFLTDEKKAAQRKRISRAAKYAPANPLSTVFNLTCAAFIIAFFMQVFSIYPVVILTGSMAGEINRGSLVIMRRLSYEEVIHRVQVGDILHYHAGRVEFVHRVIEFTYTQDEIREFVTKGDANEFPDPRPLAQADVIGIPMLIIPFIGYPNVIFRAITGGFT